MYKRPLKYTLFFLLILLFFAGVHTLFNRLDEYNTVITIKSNESQRVYILSHGKKPNVLLGCNTSQRRATKANILIDEWPQKISLLYSGHTFNTTLYPRDNPHFNLDSLPSNTLSTESHEALTTAYDKGSILISIAKALTVLLVAGFLGLLYTREKPRTN